MPLPFLLGAGLVTQGLSSAFGLAKGVQALNQSRKIKPVFTPYEVSQQAKDMLGRATTQLNARNPFAAQAQRGILGSQANQMASIQRGVIDPSQALAMTTAVAAQADKSINDQFMMEQQLQQQREANLMNAQGVMIGEGDKVKADRDRKFQFDTQMKQDLQNAGAQSILNAGSNLASSMMGASKLQGMFGGGSSAAGGMQGLFSNPAIQSMVLNNAKSGFNNYLANRQMPTTGLPTFQRG